MAWSTWCVYIYNCSMWNDLLLLSINLFTACFIGSFRTLSTSGPDHPDFVKGSGGHTQLYGPSFGCKIRVGQPSGPLDLPLSCDMHDVPEIVWKCSDQDLQPFPTKCRTEVHLLFHCMIKIKFIKNYVSIYFFIKLRTKTDLYGGHSANVRKSRSELTTRAPVLLFCKIQWIKT